MVVLPDTISLKELAQSLHTTHEGSQMQRLYPVVNSQDELIGVVTRRDLQKFIQEHAQSNEQQNYTLSDLVNTHPVVAYPDEPLRAVVYRMAQTGYTRLPVVERENPKKLVGLISLAAVLQARARSLEEERKRERILRMRFLFPTNRPVVKMRKVGKEVSDLEPTPREPSKPLMD
jgi:CBS-domain-containing membrane protein